MNFIALSNGFIRILYNIYTVGVVIFVNWSIKFRSFCFVSCSLLNIHYSLDDCQESETEKYHQSILTYQMMIIISNIRSTPFRGWVPFQFILSKNTELFQLFFEKKIICFCRLDDFFVLNPINK